MDVQVQSSRNFADFICAVTKRRARYGPIVVSRLIRAWRGGNAFIVAFVFMKRYLVRFGPSSDMSMTLDAPAKDVVSNAHFVELLHDVLRVLLPVISIDLP